MHLKLLTTVHAPNGGHQGDIVYDLDAALARAWIAAGLAEEFNVDAESYSRRAPNRPTGPVAA